MLFLILDCSIKLWYCDAVKPYTSTTGVVRFLLPNICVLKPLPQFLPQMECGFLLLPPSEVDEPLTLIPWVMKGNSLPLNKFQGTILTLVERVEAARLLLSSTNATHFMSQFNISRRTVANININCVEILKCGDGEGFSLQSKTVVQPCFPKWTTQFNSLSYCPERWVFLWHKLFYRLYLNCSRKTVEKRCSWREEEEHWIIRRVERMGYKLFKTPCLSLCRSAGLDWAFLSRVFFPRDVIFAF